MSKLPPLLDALPDKLYEADFFLSQLEQEYRPVAARYYFSAYASAARSVTFVLKKSMGNLPGFQEWYAPHLERLRREPIARLMKDQRNSLQKEGGGGITGGTMAPYSRRIVHRLSDRVAARYDIAPDDNDVVQLCREHMACLVEIVADSLDHYRPLLDPHVFLTEEWLRERGMSPDDIEEQKGFPRGYTRSRGAEDDWEERIHALICKDPSSPDISDLVDKRLANRIISPANKPQDNQPGAHHSQ